MAPTKKGALLLRRDDRFGNPSNGALVATRFAGDDAIDFIFSPGFRRVIGTSPQPEKGPERAMSSEKPRATVQ